MIKENTEKTILRNKLFNKFFHNKKGISAIDLYNKTGFIRNTYNELNKLITKDDENFTAYENVEFLKKVKLNNKEYIIIHIGSFKFIVIDVEERKTVDTNIIHKIFNDDDFKFNIDNHGFSDLYEFLPTNYVNEIIEIYKNNELVFSMPTHISYETSYNDATALLIINTNYDAGMLMFDTPDQFLYEHIFLGNNLEPVSMSSPTLDKRKGLGIADKIKDIIIPYDCIPENLLLAINEYELVNTIYNLKYKRLNDIKKKIFDKYGKSLLDLTEDEIETSSHRIKKEYRQLLRCLILEFGKYTEPTVVYAETLRDLRDRLDEFKTAYYKKHPNEKR